MSSVATAVVGSAVVGGYMSNQAANTAADAQKNAARSSNELQKYMYDQDRKDLEPWRQAGAGALSQLQDPSFQQTFKDQDFKTDPGYEFRLAEGQKALEASAAARGNRLSTGTLKALMNYNQGAASEEYNNAYNRFNNDQSTRFNRLSSIAGLGQTAQGQTSAAGQNYANAVSGNNNAAANATGGAAVAGANAFNQTLGTGANTWMAYQYMNAKNKPVSDPAPGTSAGQSYYNLSNIA